MFAIDNWVWVVPGLVGLWSYNRTLSYGALRVDGWAYLFVVVCFALPYYFLSILLPLDEQERLLKFLGVIFNLLLASFIAFWLGKKAADIVSKRRLALPTHSTFHICCYDWHKRFVFITLKNRKVYLGILDHHTQDLSMEPVIRIIPFSSGYRDEHRKINWTFHYPVRDDIINSKIEKIERRGIIIPYKEIETFSLWSHSRAYTDAPQVDRGGDSSAYGPVKPEPKIQ